MVWLVLILLATIIAFGGESCDDYYCAKCNKKLSLYKKYKDKRFCLDFCRELYVAEETLNRGRNE